MTIRQYFVPLDVWDRVVSVDAPESGVGVSPPTPVNTTQYRAIAGVLAPETLTVAGSAIEYTALSSSQVAARLGSGVAPTISTWEAGFPADLTWSADNVVDPGDPNLVGLRIRPKHPSETGRPYRGGEIQFSPVGHELDNQGVQRKGFRCGRYDAWFRLIPGQGGTVQTVFTYQYPWTEMQRELDFEFLGGQPFNPTGKGRMDCTFHLRPLDGSQRFALGLNCAVPDEAFTDFQKWSIVFNVDCYEWLYNDRPMARYIYGIGFDASLQEFDPRRHGDMSQFLPGQKHIHPNDAKWHLNRMNFFAEQWCSALHPNWLGQLNLPADPKPLLIDRLNFTEFNPSTIAFQHTDWSVSRVNATTLAVTIHAFRPAGFVPTALQCSVNGGAWQNLGGKTLGTYNVNVPSSGTPSLRIRALAVSPSGDYTLTGNASNSSDSTPATEWQPTKLGSKLIIWREPGLSNLNPNVDGSGGTVAPGGAVGRYEAVTTSVHATQADAARRPLYRVVDGKKSLEFNGTSQFMSFSAATTKVTMALGVEFLSPTVAGHIYGSGGSTAVSLRKTSANALDFNGAVTAPLAAGPHVVIAVWDTAEARVYVDGALAATASNGASGRTWNTLFAQAAFGGWLHARLFAEVWCSDVVSTQEVSDLTKYIESRF